MKRRTFLVGAAGSVLSPIVLTGCATIAGVREKSAAIENGRTTKQEVADRFGKPWRTDTQYIQTYARLFKSSRLPEETVELWRYDFGGPFSREATWLIVGFDASGKVTAHELQENVPRYSGHPDPCFVATVVYESDHCREVAVLRDFRDRVLSRNSAGRLFVRCYYRFAPRVAVRLRTRPLWKKMVKVPLDLFVRFVEWRQAHRSHI